MTTHEDPPSDRHPDEEKEAEAVAHAGPLRRGNLPRGSQFVQEQEAASAKDKAACEARTEELRQQLKALEKELEGL
mgnify:CR=1 FL=1